jgi:nitroreductase
MKLKDLILKNRSYRRFYGSEIITEETLRELVDLARLSPSSMNMQPLKYIIAFDKKMNDIIFPCLAWAGYLKDWNGPAEEERPTGYIIILDDMNIKTGVETDHGIAAQSIMLGAVEKGLGGCILSSVNRNKLHADLNIPLNYKILLVLALGKPKETVIIEPLHGTDVKYWRDEQNIHHVPKRALDDIIVKL